MTSAERGALNLLEGDALSRSLDRWGEEAQFIVAIQECAELIKEITDVQRGRATMSGGKLMEECADVSIMIAQLIRITPSGRKQFEHYYRVKLERLLARAMDPGAQALGGGTPTMGPRYSP